MVVVRVMVWVGGSFQGSKGVGEGGLGQGYDDGGGLGYLGSK